MRMSLPLGLVTAGTAAVLSLLVSSPAAAGGLGLLASGGVHTAPAYYYNLENEQGVDLQTRPNGAVGIEALLGDRDDRVQGVFRAFVLGDAPLAKPDTGDLGEDEVTYPPADELGWSKKGVGQVGVQWGLLGDPGKLNLIAITTIGAGFATPDSLEFLMVDLGPGVTYALSDGLQVTANAELTLRYRKGLSYGGGVVAGLRYMFD